MFFGGTSLGGGPGGTLISGAGTRRVHAASATLVTVLRTYRATALLPITCMWLVVREQGEMARRKVENDGNCRNSHCKEEIRKKVIKKCAGESLKNFLEKLSDYKWSASPKRLGAAALHDAQLNSDRSY